MQVTVLSLGTWEDSTCWFSDKKIGHNYFVPFLKELCAQAGIEGHFSNQGLLLNVASQSISSENLNIFSW